MTSRLVGLKDIELIAGDAMSIPITLSILDTETQVKTPLDLTGATVTGKVREQLTTDAVEIDLDTHLSVTDAANGVITLANTLAADTTQLMIDKGHPDDWRGEYAIRVVFPSGDSRTYLGGKFTVHVDGTRPAP